MSAFVAEKFIWINIPKMAGKYTGGLMNHSNIEYTKIGKGHKWLDQHGNPIIDVNNYPAHTLYMTVRHPITFLASLWQHRQMSRKPWMDDGIENNVGVNDWNQFIMNVINNPGWIDEWTGRWIHTFPSAKLLKMEIIWDEWIREWKQIGQPFNYDKAVEYKDQQVNRDPNVQILLNSLSQNQIDRLYQSQKSVFESWEYDKQWEIVPYRKVYDIGSDKWKKQKKLEGKKKKLSV